MTDGSRDEVGEGGEGFPSEVPSDPVGGGESNAIVGEKDKATRILKALATEETTPEAEWAIRYPTLSGWR
jgi:hypothetical protein